MPSTRPFKSGFCYGYIGGEKLKPGMGKYRLVTPVVDSTDVARLKRWLQKAKAQAGADSSRADAFDYLMRVCDGTDVATANARIKAVARKTKEDRQWLIWCQQVCFRLDDIIDGTDRVTYPGGSTESRLEWQWFGNFTSELILLYNRLGQVPRRRILSLIADGPVGDDGAGSVNLKPYRTVIRSVERLCVRHLVDVVDEWKVRASGVHKDEVFFRLFHQLHVNVLLALWYAWWQEGASIQLQQPPRHREPGDAPPNPEITHRHGAHAEVHHASHEAPHKHRIPDVPNSPPHRHGGGHGHGHTAGQADQSWQIANLMNVNLQSGQNLGGVAY